MAQNLKFEYEVVDKASKNLDRVRKSVQKNEQAVDKMGQTAKDASSKTTAAGKSTSKASAGFDVLGGRAGGAAGKLGKLGGKLGAAAKAAGPAAVAVAGVTAALAATAAATKKAVDATAALIDQYKEQRDVNNQLVISNQKLTGSAEHASSVFEEQQGIIGEWAEKTRFSDESLHEAISTYQDLTGELQTGAEAQENLNTITGLAQQRNIDAAQAAENLARIQKGKFRGLERTTSLTREQVRELRKMEDQQKAAAIATKAVRQQVDGTAEAMEGDLFGAMKNVNDATGDLQQEFGEVIVESEALDPAFRVLHDLLRDLESFVDDNEESLRQYGQAVSIFSEIVLKDLADAIREAGGLLADVARAFGVIGDQSQSAAENVEQLVVSTHKLVMATQLAVDGVTTMAQAIPGLGTAASALDQAYDALMPTQEEINEKAEEMSNGFEDATGKLKGAASETMTYGDILSNLEGVMSDLSDSVSEDGFIIDAESEVKDAALELQILRETNEVKKRELELEQELAKINDEEDLSGEERRKKREIAREKARQDIAEIREQRAEEAREQEQRLEDAEREGEILAAQTDHREERLKLDHEIEDLQDELDDTEDETKRVAIAQQIANAKQERNDLDREHKRDVRERIADAEAEVAANEANSDLVEARVENERELEKLRSKLADLPRGSEERQAVEAELEAKEKLADAEQRRLEIEQERRDEDAELATRQALAQNEAQESYLELRERELQIERDLADGKITEAQAERRRRAAERDHQNKMTDLQDRRTQRAIEDAQEWAGIVEGGAAGLEMSGAVTGAADDELAEIDERISRLKDQDADESRIEALEREREARQRNIDAMREQLRVAQQVGDSAAQMADQIAVLTEATLESARGAEAAVAGLQAMSGLGQAAAEGLASGPEEAARIMGLFNAAQAVTAGALALAFPPQAPQYLSAAAQFGVGAVKNFAIAGASGGGGGGGAGSGAGAAGGGSPSIETPDISRTDIVETQKRAFAEALREERGESREAQIIIDQSGSTFLERDPASRRRTDEMLRNTRLDRV